jgi:hypothetical protein
MGRTCQFCGGDEDECTVWSDADMGWVCEVTDEIHPDDPEDERDEPDE